MGSSAVSSPNSIARCRAQSGCQLGKHEETAGAPARKLGFFALRRSHATWAGRAGSEVPATGASAPDELP